MYALAGIAGAASTGVQVGASAAGTAVSTAATAGVIAASTAAFATLGIGAAALALMAWLNRKGPQQKIATTHIVDQLEPVLKQNLKDFQSGTASRDQALAVFDQVWAEVVNGCGDPALGNPGKNCISDRQPGGKWDWFAYYRDPIANAPDTSLLSSSSNLLPVLGIALLAAGLVASL